MLQALAILGGVAMAGTLWVRGQQYLLAWAGSLHPEPMPPDRVILADAPAWMSPAVRDQLQRVAAEGLSGATMDVAGLDRSARRFQANPWVQRLVRMERIGSANGSRGGRTDAWLTSSGLRVLAEYRRPVALVAGPDGRGYRWVDARGVLLPGVFRGEHVDELGLPVIDGVSEAPPIEGRRWIGEDLSAGLAMLPELAEVEYGYRLGRIDVSRRDARGRVMVSLWTRRPINRIVWGLAPGGQGVLEPSSASKRRALEAVLAVTVRAREGGRVIWINREQVLAEAMSQEEMLAASGGTALARSDPTHSAVIPAGRPNGRYTSRR